MPSGVIHSLDGKYLYLQNCCGSHNNEGNRQRFVSMKIFNASYSRIGNCFPAGGEKDECLADKSPEHYQSGHRTSGAVTQAQGTLHPLCKLPELAPETCSPPAPPCTHGQGHEFLTSGSLTTCQGQPPCPEEGADECLTGSCSHPPWSPHESQGLSHSLGAQPSYPLQDAPS